MSVEADREDPEERGDWPARADRCEAAVVARSVRRLWALPATRLGVPRDPPARADRLFVRWQFWWQAHLLDCAVDAFERAPTMARGRLIRSIARGARWRNGGRWRNNYLDDTAWWALALDRARPLLGTAAATAVARTARELIAAWPDDDLGGLPWRRNDEFRNAPANGPAAILLARRGFPVQAVLITDWIERELLLPSGLIADGIRAGDRRVESTVYTYVQGVVLGAELEQVLAGADPARLHRQVAAIASGLIREGVLVGHDGGDGGLFSGILARYLARTALLLPGSTAADDRTRGTCRALVLRSAGRAWRTADHDRYGVRFRADWTTRTRPGGEPDPHLSTQLSGWMLTEAAAQLHRAGSE